MSGNKIQYKRFNYYTKAVFTSVLSSQGTRIEIDYKPKEPDIEQEITVKYLSKEVYKYTRYKNNIDTISSDGNIVAVSNHNDDDVRDFYNMLNSASVMHDKHNMDVNDIRACAFITKITQER